MEALRYNAREELKFLYFDVPLVDVLVRIFSTEGLGIDTMEEEVSTIIHDNPEYRHNKRAIMGDIEDLFSDCVTRLFDLVGESAQSSVCLGRTESGSFLFEGVENA